MRTANVTVRVAGGVHARVALELARCAARYRSSAYLLGQRTVSLSSVMDVLSLAVGEAEVVTLLTDGLDEEAALAELRGILQDEPDQH